MFRFIPIGFLFIAAAMAHETRWPMPDWEVADTSSKMESPECIEFKRFSTGNKDFHTDGLLIIKDGQVNYEYYDKKYDVTKPHALWSVTKTITGALLGMAVRDGRLNLDQSLSEFYPGANPSQRYSKIILKNLLYMDTGFIWDERKIDVLSNPLVRMLYSDGHVDMARFAAGRKIIPEGPSYKWNYSTGTPTMTMGVLKKVYGDEENREMPWRNLFNPLGMKNITFERDLSGTFIGGASAFATPRDLAKIGYLYLNNGIWNNEILLPPEWIKLMLTPSPGYVSPGTVITDITEDGVYGGSIWLNRKVKEGVGIPYPHSPEDLYMAVGYMGQYLIMLPSQKMIIVRTGYDREFNSKLDPLISRALSCFYNPKTAVADVIPKQPQTISLGTIVRNIKNAFQATTLQSAIAKTVCSCHLVSGLDVNTCLKRNNLELSKLVTTIDVVKEKELSGNISIQVKLSALARLFKHHPNTAKAYYNPREPELGCTLR
jgi:CubicO group peptidase (beta-lactamase class C family)